MQSFRNEAEEEGLSVCVCKIRRQRKERKKESIGGSIGSRDERESTEEGCGRVVFTETQDAVVLFISICTFIMVCHSKPKT